jgi:hypothetical protein
MAESKFTSGPWVAEHAKSFGNTYRIKAGSLVLCAVVSRELIGDEFDLEETKANAELMADAPEDAGGIAGSLHSCGHTARRHPRRSSSGFRRG